VDGCFIIKGIKGGFALKLALPIMMAVRGQSAEATLPPIIQGV
jgi:hypothetical protein